MKKNRSFPRSLSPLLLLALAAPLLGWGCAPRTVVMVRDAHDTMIAGRALGGYTKEGETGGGTRTVTVATRVSDVRTGDVVSVRNTGAYRDPANPALLHEPHRVLRLDQPSRWRLAPAADGPILQGPAVALRRGEYAPGATRGESGREIMASRRAIERTAEAVGQVEQQQRDLAAGVAETSGTLAKNQGNLLDLQRKLSDRVERLETRPRESVVPGPRVPLTNPGGANPGATPTPGGLANPPTVGPTPPSASPPSSGVY